MNIEIGEILSVEECGEFFEEYVYDVSMADQSIANFFANDILVHNSNFFEVTDIINKLSTYYLTEDGDVTEDFLKIENTIKNNLNTKIKAWAVDKLNSKDCRFEFARESVAPSAIWTGAKNYVMHIRNMKGIKTENIKYKGLSLVKATIPKQAKDIAKDIVKGMLSAASKKDSDTKFFESYDLFSKLPDAVVSERFSLKVLDDYERYSNGFQTVSKCPRHAKYSLYYNHLLKILGLEKKYPKIENGHKVKIAYVRDNKYNLEGIAYLDFLPPEFELEIDREKMFAKCITNCLKPLYAAVSWEIPNPKLQFEDDLSEIFA